MKIRIIFMAILLTLLMAVCSLEFVKASETSNKKEHQVNCDDPELISNLLPSVKELDKKIEKVEFLHADQKNLIIDGYNVLECIGYFIAYDKVGNQTLLPVSYNLINFESMEQKREFMEKMKKYENQIKENQIHAPEPSDII